MKDHIIKLLKQYEDEIMTNTLGDSVDEDEERYVRVYKYEWENHKQGIAYTLAKLKNSDTLVDSTALAFIIISEWSGVMTFSEGDLNIEGLKEVCKKILDALI